jgi:hypothetical protein
MAEQDKRELTRAERIFVRISVTQTVLAVVGIFTGAIALYAALNEADAVRKQQQAAVWPHIRVSDISFGRPGEEKFMLIVGNRGIGPARIKSVAVTVDGEPQTNWRDIVRMVAEEERFGISSGPVAGMVLAPNEDVTAISVEVPHASKKTTEAFRDLVRSRRAKMLVCYCSVFDECWNLDAPAGKTDAVAACPQQNPDSRI